ncbi:MAG: hypothetical protein U5R48_01225 [Gammaproteobacteria bacterium]|nr:hypothetical protein [Gammaproteobacteria bacterium]
MRAMRHARRPLRRVASSALAALLGPVLALLLAGPAAARRAD